MAVQHSLQVIDGRRDDDDGSPPRTGTEWTCAAHIITAVIGSGVLSLAWGVAQLGWVAGPVCMLCLAVVTYVSASLLSDCYRCQDAEKGPRNRSYMDAVRVYLGKKQTWACGSLQYLSLYGCGVAYTITTATSIRAILKANCYHASTTRPAASTEATTCSCLVGRSSSSPSYRTSTTWRGSPSLPRSCPSPMPSSASALASPAPSNTLQGLAAWHKVRKRVKALREIQV